jgi:DNA primase
MGTIPSQTIEQIAAANDIVEVIGTYFPLKRAGSTFKALCPFHQEKTPSFTVSPSRQTFHCFGCGAGGSVFRFVMDYEHLEFPAAVKKLAQRVGIPVIEERGVSSGDEDRQHEARKVLLQLHSEAAEWFHENLVKKKVGEPAREYLKGRGIDKRIAKDWQIGFAPESWDAFLSWGIERGYQQRLLLESGLIARREEGGSDNKGYDRFRNRIMFPIHNDVGEVIAFSGRILDKDAETAKYVNSPETPLFRKGRVLFGLHKTKRGLIEADCAIVCEGQLDLITLFEAGITNVVAPQGTAFTEQQARILKRFVSEVVLCFDADAAGQKAAERSLDALLQNNLVVRVAEMPAGEDPDSMVRNRGREEFEKLVSGARDFFDFFIDTQASLASRASYFDRIQVARRIAGTIARVPDMLVRGEIVAKVAARLNLSSGELAKLLPVIATNEIERPVVERDFLKVPQAIEHLCRLALRDPDFRSFLASEDWKRVLAEHEFGGVLAAILEADFDPTKPNSIEAFLQSVDEGRRRFFSHLLTEKLPTEKNFPTRKGFVTNEVDFPRVGREFWTSLKAEALRKALKRVETQIAQPNVTTGELVNLQKQILDLTEQLRELSAFSPARVLDN